MICTTLGYLIQNGQYLMLHRIKKEKDISKDKWIGIGGKLEPGEGPLEAMKRECLEETGLTWIDPELRGIVTFNYRKTVDDPLFCEQMFLFTGSQFTGKIRECDEGELCWVSKERIPELNLWKGDLIFFDLLEKGTPLFFLRLDYVGDQLMAAFLNDQPIALD